MRARILPDRVVQGRAPRPHRLLGLELRRLARARVPEGLPERRWLEHYATLFDTVEVNSTFYRLARRDAVARWVEQAPAGLRVRRQGEPLPHAHEAPHGHGPGRRAPLRAHRAARRARASWGRSLWQLPGQLPARRRAAGGRARRSCPPGRHTFEFRHPTWFTDEVYALLREHGVALVIGDDPRRPFQTVRADHRLDVHPLPHGAPRAARQLLARPSSRSGPSGSRSWRRAAEVFAYFNNDWKGTRSATRRISDVAGDVLCAVRRFRQPCAGFGRGAGGVQFGESNT